MSTYLNLDSMSILLRLCLLFSNRLYPKVWKIIQANGSNSHSWEIAELGFTPGLQKPKAVALSVCGPCLEGKIFVRPGLLGQRGQMKPLTAQTISRMGLGECSAPRTTHLGGLLNTAYRSHRALVSWSLCPARTSSLPAHSVPACFTH